VVKKTFSLAILAAAVMLLAGMPAQANSLDVNEDAALPNSVGSNCNGQPCGLEVLLVDQGQAYVESDHPNQEPTVSIKLMLDANGVSLPDLPNSSPGRVRILKGYREVGNNPRQHLFVTLKRNIANTQYRVSVLQRDNNENFQFVGEFFWGNGPHELRIVWDATGGAGNNGNVQVFRDNVLRADTDVNVTGWNIDMVRMGVIDMASDNFTAIGSILVDEYVNTRD
jgi:hypothetical protein